MALIPFVKRTLAKSAEVNSNLNQIAQKKFLVAWTETTSSLTVSASVGWNLLSTSWMASGNLPLPPFNLCDVLGAISSTPVTVGGKKIVGQITDITNRTVSFYKENNLSLTASITLTVNVKLVFPVETAFLDLPEDVFRREFEDSYFPETMKVVENLSSSCDDTTVTFNLSYIPTTDSILINKNSMLLSEGSSYDYSVDYSGKKIIFTEAPLQNSILVIRYDIISTI